MIYSNITAQVKLATFEMLNSHIWLIAIILDNTVLESTAAM